MARRPDTFRNTTAIASVHAAISLVEADGELRKVPDLATRFTDSAAMLDYWNKTDDLIIGYEALKKSGTVYLPKFPGEEDTDYNFRLEATKLTNVYADIIEALAAKPFEEEVSLIKNEKKEIPEDIKNFTEDVDGSGSNLTVFASHVFYNGINSAIHWIFIDYPVIKPRAGQIRTIADDKRENIRPFWSHVLGRNVLGSKVEIISGKEVLSYIKIWEPGEPNHIREFVRDPSGVVTWTLYMEQHDQTTNKKTYVEIDNGVISIGVIPLVPFMTGRRDGRTFKLYPVMKSAADLQVELYLQESALKFAKIMAAYPMLAGNGVTPPKDAAGRALKLAVGPGKVLYAPSDGVGNSGFWTYVEPSATTLTFLAKDIEDTIRNLRELGRQPLTANSGNLTVITTAVAAGKVKSIVGAWALNLKNTLENALVITLAWMNVKSDEYDPEVNVYNEFDNFAENEKDIEALGKMRTDGDLSQETYWFEMKRRRVLSPEFEADEERERILGEVPSDDGSDDDLEPPIPDPNQSKLPL